MRNVLMGALALGVVSATAAQAADVNLRYAHFMGAESWQQQKIFKDWADAVAAESDGAIGVTVYPAQTLGKAPAGYDNAKNGIADIAWTVQGYTANRFPLSQIVELPGLFETGAVGSCAFQKLYDSGALDAEYEDTHVLFVHTHSPGHLHTNGVEVKTLDDLKGLKIRRPTTVVGNLLTELGAEPVGMPAPATYEAMQRGTIDGYMLPWESVKSFRVFEVTEHHTEFGFYALAFVSTMNKAKYESLSPEEKKVIDDNSGMKWSVIAGAGYDEADKEGLELAKETGTFTTIEGAEREKWQQAAQRATDAYIAELEGQGLPGQATYDAVKGYVTECEAELN
ncbi:TRAP transporter substrate-binding protein [Oceanicella sp. SM1341]|uniref:TRAP transporter substrate-binding protein n=1 Tax=Oceanicella sp. SM1341 TaxID=1548889 RepID=UPI000E489672|nr:TRAP transporter substrate-binding protein [Oceanicella sp. SM1341]